MPQYVFRFPDDPAENERLTGLLNSLVDYFELITYPAIVVVTDDSDRNVSMVLSEMTDLMINSPKKPIKAKKPTLAPARNLTGRPAGKSGPKPAAERPCLECSKPTDKPSGYCSDKCYRRAYGRRRRAGQHPSLELLSEELDYRPEGPGGIDSQEE
jgi:hypothetical protein